MCGEDQIRLIVREEVDRLARRLETELSSIRRETQLQRQWTNMPDDYKLAAELPPGVKPRTIRSEVYEALRDGMRDTLSVPNLVKILGLLSLFLTVLNQIAERF